MDLIYEGITTEAISVRIASFSVRQNGPDLRRDYDDWRAPGLSFIFIVRMDLIYEGITTIQLRCFLIRFWVRKDLIYEGITTCL